MTEKSQKRKKPTFKQSTWNFRTILTSLNVDLNAISDIRKTATINDELLKLEVDIANSASNTSSHTVKIKTIYFIGRAKTAMNVKNMVSVLQLRSPF